MNYLFLHAIPLENRIKYHFTFLFINVEEINYEKEELSTLLSEELPALYCLRY